MSYSWHRDRRALARHSAGAHGFYDSAYQLAVYRHNEVQPDVIVDHELTHANLVNNTSIGLLEHVLVFLYWTARQSDQQAPANIAQALISTIRAATEMVHEAVAWFGTELQTNGHENTRVPAPYSRDVARLRTLFATIHPTTPATMPSEFDTVMTIAESVATYALNMPSVGELWSLPEQLSPPTLVEFLERAESESLRRFRLICSLLQNAPFSETEAWSRAMWHNDEPNAKERRRRLPAPESRWSMLWPSRTLSAVFRSDLPRSHTIRVIRQLAIQIGLLDGTSPPSFERIESSWQSFKATHIFNPAFDKYSQVTVVETPTNNRELLYSNDDDSRTALATGSYVLVSLVRGHPDEFNFVQGDAVDRVILTAHSGQRDYHASGEYRRPTWYADVASARAFLERQVRSKPIVVSSLGYSWEDGDFRGTGLLRNIPHVVGTIRDLRSLWLSLGFYSTMGLRGCRTIEWRPMPSLAGWKYFGFLLFKPADNPFPVVLMPCLVSFYERMMTITKQMKSPYGVELLEGGGNPYDWLGIMTNAVLTTVMDFERKRLEGASKPQAQSV
jgi:hypothetical protein